MNFGKKRKEKNTQKEEVKETVAKVVTSSKKGAKLTRAELLGELKEQGAFEHDVKYSQYVIKVTSDEYNAL